MIDSQGAKKLNPKNGSSNLLRRTLKPVPVAGFILENKPSVKVVSKLYHYRTPRIVKAASGWYIEYYYRVPPLLLEKFDNKKWLRCRAKQDINKRAGSEREEYALWLRQEIEDSLKQGYNPLEPLIERVESERVEEKTVLTATDAMLLFLDKWGKRGLEVYTFDKYKKVVNRFLDWLVKKGLPHTNITSIKQVHAQEFLNDMKKEHGFGNREFNNHYDFLRTAFNFLVKHKHIPESPLAGVDKMKTKTTKHRYYDEKSLRDITKVLELKDPYTLLAFQTVYYLCVRSEKELKHLRVGNINWEENKILATETKGGSERYIPMDNHLKELFLKAGIDKYPDDYYIFSIKGKPGPRPIGKFFFGKKFRRIRDAAGLSSDFTIYGAKHTRIVHLKSDGVSDANIMSLTGHKDFSAYTKYLRDLGLTANIEKINEVSRKI